jgi:hypothetical protein
MLVVDQVTEVLQLKRVVMVVAVQVDMLAEIHQELQTQAVVVVQETELAQTAVRVLLSFVMQWLKGRK